MIRQISAAHPVPDEQGLKAAEAIGALADQAGKKDLVICLFSGGASALIADCPEGITLKELQETSGLLLRSGEIGRAACREKSVSVRVDLGGRRIIKKKK